MEEKDLEDGSAKESSSEEGPPKEASSAIFPH
jgi:hypothetical protein